ncbi:metallophosphoesterase family protein [Mesorhizobium sp. BAC0120]|uniref:metallophosphoesterase family protein n=1 Tax=Mesorhizobium sp. BAC0120 TaxID=3090670 RepID=UPI00298C0553|nr:metallophosphoesterase family protein [Mesorhizobium sp. BAC0120]MDW6022404.1 metallophosphoesterase family protein [Mesorhizobium sp. BAC0120]
MPRIAVLADIHGNILALDAVLDDLVRRGGADLVVNLGDCVSGPLWPRETMERLQALDWPTVRGNHDRRVAFDPLEEMAPSDRFAHDRLEPSQREWLASIPVQAKPAPGILAFHARPDHDERYLTEVITEGRLARAPLATIVKRLGELDPAHSILLCGHSHRVELLRLPDGRVIFNPGSVGCPAYHDPDEPAHVSEQGSPHARYGMIEVGSGASADRFEAIAVSYDHQAAARRAGESGRPEWAYALSTGFMPH